MLAKHLKLGLKGGSQSLGRAWAAGMLMLGSKDPFHRDVWPTHSRGRHRSGLQGIKQSRVFRGTGGHWPGPAPEGGVG